MKTKLWKRHACFSHIDAACERWLLFVAEEEEKDEDEEVKQKVKKPINRYVGASHGARDGLSFELLRGRDPRGESVRALLAKKLAKKEEGEDSSAKASAKNEDSATV